MQNNRIINELDTVVLAHDIQEHGLRAGDIGAVVHCYNTTDAYEVEFVTGEGETIAIVTLNNDEIRSMQQREILHVRDLLYSTRHGLRRWSPSPLGRGLG